MALGGGYYTLTTASPAAPCEVGGAAPAAPPLMQAFAGAGILRVDGGQQMSTHGAPSGAKMRSQDAKRRKKVVRRSQKVVNF